MSKPLSYDPIPISLPRMAFSGTISAIPRRKPIRRIRYSWITLRLDNTIVLFGRDVPLRLPSLLRSLLLNKWRSWLVHNRLRFWISGLRRRRRNDVFRVENVHHASIGDHVDLLKLKPSVGVRLRLEIDHVLAELHCHVVIAC